MGTVSTPLVLSTLRRRPDVEDPTLLAHDATDELLVERALADVAARGLSGSDILVVGERHGAITLSLLAVGLRGIRVVQDRLAHERALDANALDAGLPQDGYVHARAGADAAIGARLILWQLPRSVAGVRAALPWLAQAAPDALLVAGGRVKHLSRGMNAPLEAGFGAVEPQLAQRKSRLLEVRRDPSRTARAASITESKSAIGGQRLALAGLGEAFGQAALDPGTAFLLKTLHELGYAPPHADATVVDLGCGNGTIAVWAALSWPEAGIEATDDSADAVASAIASTMASGVAARVDVVRADAGDHLADGSADVVILNPPFHQGGTVHTGIATKLMRAAARQLRPGGTLLCVWNSHLRYRPRLERLIGPTEQLARDKTFTVTASTRRG